MKYLTIILSAIFFTACASTHPGYKGKAVDRQSSPDIIVSAQKVDTYSDPTNVFYNLVIENKGDQWLDVESVEVEFPNDESVSHKILVDSEIDAWAKSYAIRARRDDHNANLGVAGLILGGLVLMVAAAGGGGGAGDLAKVGAAASLAGTGIEATRETLKSKRYAENSAMVPSNYVFTGVQIPSSGLAEKWLLVHVPQRRIAKKMLVRLKMKDQNWEYRIPTGRYGQDELTPQVAQGLTAQQLKQTTVETAKLF